MFSSFDNTEEQNKEEADLRSDIEVEMCLRGGGKQEAIKM